jgi:hypothetical protein
MPSFRTLALPAVLASLALAVGCAAQQEDDSQGDTSAESAFSQEQVDRDATLKALQQAASNVNQYEISVKGIQVPVPNASVGANINGFGTRGLDWFRNPDVSYPDNKSWDQGSDTGKKCQWAAVFRFQAIFQDPPAEAKKMREMEGGRWSGSFWSWVDDYASTDSVGHPTASYAWSSGLWKWIAASGKNDTCRIPTRTMVKRMMESCYEVAKQNGGDPKGCRMPAFDARLEPLQATDAGGSDASDAASDASPASDAGTDATDAGRD